MTTDDELAAIALELAMRVRDDTPETNGQWLAERLPDPDDWWRLCFVLAAAVPDNQTWRSLTGWIHLRPCGTTAAAARHRARGERLCEPCREAERRRDRIRKRIRRAA